MSVVGRLTSIFKLVKKAFSQYKWQIVLLTVLGFVSGLLEGIGINALVPLMSFVLGEGQGGGDVVSQLIEKFFGFFNIHFSVNYLLGFIIVMFILKAVMTLVLEYLKIKIVADYEYETRKDLLTKILQADWAHLLKQKLGYLETVLMIDVTTSANLFRQISNGITILTGLFIYLVIAINISFEITLVTMVLGTGLFFIIKPLVYRTKLVAYQRAQTNKDTAHHINENILGIKTVKSMVVEPGVLAKGEDYFKKLKDFWIKSNMYEVGSTSFLEPVSLIFVSLIFAYSYQSPDFDLGVLAAIVYLIHRIFVYVQQLQRTWHKFNHMYPHLVSVINYQDQAVDSKEVNSGKEKFQFSNQLDFVGVNFSYSAEKPVLTDINFSIAKGAMVGLIGPSGVGKTTLVDLILRLLEPQQGKILLDDKNINHIDLSQWRQNIGYVSQDIFLINDTIANNIKFYHPDITDQDMKQAAAMANILEFIESLPEKFDTVIGERGVMVSAGQRQRIVIARVLARKPQFLVLDEATSALDNESEAQIQKVIKSLKGKITVLAIAHRLSTVMDSDQLIVLQQGQVAEQGAPQALLKDKDSLFFKAYNIRE